MLGIDSDQGGGARVISRITSSTPLSLAVCAALCIGGYTVGMRVGQMSQDVASVERLARSNRSLLEAMRESNIRVVEAVVELKQITKSQQRQIDSLRE